MDWTPVFSLQAAGILFWLFVFSGITLLLFYWLFFSRLAFYRPVKKPFNPAPVSVVICVKNQLEQLKRSLPAILEQDFHEFEVVVVDDASDDQTGNYLQELKDECKILKVVTLNENVNFYKGKKLPLSVGIKSARFDVILLTDAGCLPASRHWITRMADNFIEGREIVLGYNKYEHKPGIFNKWVRYHDLFRAMKYLGMAVSGHPYMGIGKNLAYRKELFYRVKGFTSHYKIMSGDDDLFVNRVANANNTAIEVSQASHTVSPGVGFRTWLYEQKKYLNTGGHYKIRHRLLLGVFTCTNLLFYPLLLSIIALNSFSGILLITIFVFLLKTITTCILFFRLTRTFGEEKIFPISLLLEVVYPVINLIFVLVSLLYPKRKWN